MTNDQGSSHQMPVAPVPAAASVNRLDPALGRIRSPGERGRIPDAPNCSKTELWKACSCILMWWADRASSRPTAGEKRQRFGNSSVLGVAQPLRTGSARVPFGAPRANNPEMPGRLLQTCSFGLPRRSEWLQ